MIKLHKVGDKKYISEIFQTLDIKFAFVTKTDRNNYTQVHQEIKCRDFLGDCIWSRKTKQDVNIYNFKYSYKENPYDVRKTRLSLTFPSADSLENFKNNFKNLNTLEKLYNIPLSKWKETEDKQTLIIEASSVWQSCVWKMSLFTYFIKVYSYKDITVLEKPERAYAVLLTDKVLEKFMSNVRKRREILSTSLYTAHNNSGFFSILRKYNKEMYKILMGGV